MNARAYLLFIYPLEITLHTTQTIIIFLSVFLFVCVCFFSCFFFFLLHCQNFLKRARDCIEIWSLCRTSFSITFDLNNFFYFSLTAFFFFFFLRLSLHILFTMCVCVCALKSFTFIWAPSGIYLCSIAFEMLLLKYGNRNVTIILLHKANERKWLKIIPVNEETKANKTKEFGWAMEEMKRIYLLSFP